MITLEQIEAAHSNVAAMIEAFRKQPLPTEYAVAGVKIPLAPGERYAGLILGEDGQPDYHLILLPGEAESVSWKDACIWAGDRDASLPTRREQSLLFANLKGEFEPAWYWSGEEHEENDGWAWCQYFDDGDQDNCRQFTELRARAVRRFIPSVI
ncbi:DUF1566 domain-containing protein [Cupriavidus sp.]|uniref:DUF1566 domain-containing protein n=1 Tax=Cupriavidus sp. TaxID=1873897 RepID=UPI0025C0E3A1|nr:DUF1566 domain-containing protein [Cupriavidus sp.]MCA3185988.1 DUF1566 domain-containing protein [Cupriavidus sp.]MCA3193602.1 DUF1566 domain-containing protein [Cupriavidus sp.]MCA3199992.1 DUF1566 domain-containing protein [Cupriavidus sp.]MCA3202005.1 DUF1566 domain-containing protein [Cupriavidus sp.]